MDNTFKGFNIAICGGSIVGCSAAILLARLGANVHVFERASKTLEGRGAGIVLPTEFIQTCIELNLFDADIPRLPIYDRTFQVKDAAMANDAREIWHQVSFNISALSWGDTYHQLYKRIADTCYHIDEEVIKFHHADNIFHLETKKKHYQADMLIAADGIDSFIRKQMFANLSPQYCQYVAWRKIKRKLWKDLKKMKWLKKHFLTQKNLLM